jgi:DNA repair exonuclease SbcCD ATPase subunit
MKIESIDIQNYGALYGSHHFALAGRGLVLVLGENLDEPRMRSNGAAKSTVFDALDWALYGEVPRGDFIDSIINEEAGSNLKVQVNILDDDGSSWHINRWRGVKGHEVKLAGVALFHGATDLTTLDDNKTQELIEALLGMDREVFHALVLHAQTDTWNFAAGTDAERGKVLTKVWNMGAIDVWLETAKSRGVVAEETLGKLTGEAQVIEAKLTEVRRQDYGAQSVAWEEQQVRRRSQAETALQGLTGDYQRASAEVQSRSVLEASLAALEARAPTRWAYPPAPVPPARPAPPVAEDRPNQPVRGADGVLQKSLAEARATVGRVNAEIAVLNRQREQYLRDADEFGRTQKGICGVCRQPISQEHVAREVERLRASAEAVGVKIGPFQENLTQWQAHEQKLLHDLQVAEQVFQADMVEYQRKVREIDQRDQAARRGYETFVAGLDQRHAEALAGYQAKVREIEDAYATARAVHSQEVAQVRAGLKVIDQQAQAVTRLAYDLDLAKRHLEDIVREVNPWLVKKAEQAHREADLEQALFHSQEESKTKREEIRYIEFWIKAFGPKGLKSFIMDARVQELTDAANHWMKLLYGGTNWVRFETQVQGRSTGKLANQLNIRCFRYMPDGTVRERNYKSLSGGERQRTSLAIDMGLSQIIAARATKRWDLLINDEVFKHLDGAGREAVVDLLQQLATEKDSIFVVDHDSAFQGTFEHHVIMRKENGRSTILEQEGVAHDQEVQGSGPKENSEAVPKAVPRRRPVPRTPVTRRQRD